MEWTDEEDGWITKGKHIKGKEKIDFGNTSAKKCKYLERIPMQLLDSER